MKTNILKTSVGTLLVTSLLAFSQIAGAHQCRPGDVAGSYGYTSTGTIVTPAVGPFNAVGRVKLNEDGSFDGTQTTSVAGNLVNEVVQGTYTVNPDCTGSAVVYVYRGNVLARTSNINIVWDLSGSELRAIFVTTGTSIVIQGRKLFAELDD